MAMRVKEMVLVEYEYLGQRFFKMKYFDAHLHLPSPDESGLSALVRHIENEPHMLGGNLILNTPQEVEFTYENFRYLPQKLNLVPYFDPSIDFPEEFTRSGWYKIHPRINRITRDQISMLMDSILAVTPRPRGIMVHCYPWGPELQFNISLPLVIELAQAAPEMQVLVAHGGGYESWAFRAHTGMLRNVYYDSPLRCRTIRAPTCYNRSSAICAIRANV
jgi:hypothetical protein